jgi:hypothetical protein
MTATIDLYFPTFAEYLAAKPETSILSRLAALGSWQVDRALPIEVALCEEFGTRPTQDWPLAALARRGEELALTKGTYFIVHPAHFALQRDHFVFDQTLLLEPGVNAQLVRALNTHFASEGLYFERSKDHAFWYLTSDQPLNVKTSLPAQALGRDVRGFMPQGIDAMKCQAMINEVQMLLHDHPVNKMREVVGQVPVNSIWLSGRSAWDDLKPVYLAKKRQIFANDLMTNGLAKNAKQTCYVLPRTWQALMDSLALGEEALVVVDSPLLLEEAWFEPMWQSLRKAQVNTVRCHFGIDGMTFTLTLHPRDKWKFWRAARPIMDYLNLAYEQPHG